MRVFLVKLPQYFLLAFVLALWVEITGTSSVEPSVIQLTERDTATLLAKLHDFGSTIKTYQEVQHLYEPYMAALSRLSQSYVRANLLSMEKMVHKVYETYASSVSYRDSEELSPAAEKFQQEAQDIQILIGDELKRAAKISNAAQASNETFLTKLRDLGSKIKTAYEFITDLYEFYLDQMAPLEIYGGWKITCL